MRPSKFGDLLTGSDRPIVHWLKMKPIYSACGNSTRESILWGKIAVPSGVPPPKNPLSTLCFTSNNWAWSWSSQTNRRLVNQFYCPSLFSISKRECHLKSFPQGFWMKTKMLSQRLGLRCKLSWITSGRNLMLRNHLGDNPPWSGVSQPYEKHESRWQWCSCRCKIGADSIDKITGQVFFFFSFSFFHTAVDITHLSHATESISSRALL